MLPTDVVLPTDAGAGRWLTVDFENRVATVADLPRREDIDVQADEQIVMEFYSR